MAGWKYEKNLALFGGTRQGKSVLANQLHATDPNLSIFFAPDPEPWFVGQTVSRVENLSDAVRAGAERIVVPSSLDADLEARSAGWIHGLLRLGDKLPEFSCSFFVDEAQDVDSDALTLSTKRGLKRGIRTVIVTQDPASRDVPLTALRQCDYYGWVGPIGPMSAEYVRGKRLFDPSLMKDNPEHRVQVVDKMGNNVWQGFADNERFGP